MAATPAVQAAVPPSGPKIWLADSQALTVNHVGTADVVSPLAGGQAQPLSMVSADVDGDGIGDLLVGYSTPNGGSIAFYRGNLDAFAPQSDASFQAIGRGEFPSPFLPDAQVFAVPVRPDFLATGDFTGHGRVDLVVASRGGSTLYVFSNDGKGNFTPVSTVNLPGGVTTLAADQFGGMHLALIVGVSSGKQSFLAVYGTGAQGLAPIAAVPVNGPATNLLFGNFGDPGPDAAFLSNGQVQILRSSNLKTVTVSLPVSGVGFALGSFIWERNGGSQIAVLGSDGAVHIAVRNEFDPRVYSAGEFQALRQSAVSHTSRPSFVPAQAFPSGWKIVESFPALSTVAAGQTPVFFRTRISSNGADDVMWLSAASGQLVLISHPDGQPGNQSFLPGQVSVKPYNGTPVVALPVRTNIDGRPGIVALHQGQIGPSASMPLPDPTFFPNRFDDPVPTSPITNACNNTSNTDLSSSCSLREAVLRANAAAGADNISLAAGTYTLTRGRIASPAYDANTGTLNINDSLTITGQVDGGGNPTSIVTWTSGALTNGTSVDMIFATNEDIPAPTAANGTFANLIIENGVNHGAHNNDGDGGCMEFDTGTNGTANLSLTNVIIQNCATTQGNGGGLVTFDFEVRPGTGTVTISGSTFQNNSAVDSVSGAEGGGIGISAGTLATITNSTIKNNTSNHVVGSQAGLGGGIGLDAAETSTGFGTTAIHNSVISGNTSGAQGGGISDLATGLTLDQGTIISGNTSGAANLSGGPKDGGGIYLVLDATGCPASCVFANTVSFSKVTIINNSAGGASPGGNGGGIFTGSGGTFPTAGPMSMTFTRLAGNSATGSGSNLANEGTTVTATNNWWGTNAAASTISTTITSAVTTFDPFIVLTHSGVAQKIRINGTSGLTGDMSKDNHGNGAALTGNLSEIVGLPITFDAAVLGTITPTTQPETLGNPVPTAVATFTAGNTPGTFPLTPFGTANATVDQAVVPVNSNLIASATEIGSTATITTVGVHGYAPGEFVIISGVGVLGYNTPANQFSTILSTPTTTTFTYTTSASGLASSSGGTVDAGIDILAPPSIAKSFSPTTIQTTSGTGTTVSTVTFSITNPNSVPIISSFTDSLPTNLVVASTPTVVNGCGGTVTATAGSTTISFSNAALPSGTCSIKVNVSSAVDNTYSNSVTIDSTDAGNGNTSTASLTVINPPHITKVFGAATIPLNGTTSLTFTISSNNVNLTLSGISFTDTLPAGLVVATPNGLTNTCSTTPTAVAGSGSISLAGASLAPGSSCTISVNVQGITAGAQTNSVTVSDTTAGTGNTSSATVSVIAPPTIAKAFNPTSIALNATTSLQFTITNPAPNAISLTGVGFTDTLPTGLTVASGTSTVCGGTLTTTAPTGISLSGATVAAAGQCQFSVTVTGAVAGGYTNTTGAVTSNEGGTGNTASANLTVVAPPSIAKAFNPTTIPLNSTSSLTFTITNPAANTVPLTGVAFTDTLPTGLTVASGTSTVCGGTLTTTAPTGISLTGATIAVGGQCQFPVTVTGAVSGQYTNTTGAVSSTNGGTGNTATANLTVASPATVTKTFGAATIPLNGTTSLTISITNPNTGVALSGVAFADSLPGGLVVATPNNLNNTCGGTATAVAGSGTVSLSGGTLATSASCSVSVNVQGATAGAKTNTVTVTSTEGGASTPASASITVIAPPSIAKAFNPTSIALNTTTSLQFTITNPAPNAISLTGVGFTDTLPTGLTVASGTSTVCGGTLTTTAPTGISLTGATIAASGQCQFSVTVTGAAAGGYTNTTGAVTSNEGGTGNTASANLTVVAPPSFAKAFNPTTIALNATTSLTFTITNPAANTVALAGVAFTDTLPTGLTVANGTSTVCGGTLTTTAPTGISLTGATIAVGGQCQFSVTVTGAASGQYTNTTGAVSSTNGGTGNTATASLTVASPQNVTKTFGTTQIPLNGTTSLTFNITNSNSNLALTGLAFTDTFPVGIVVGPTPGASNSCGGTFTATAGAGSVTLSGGTLPASGSCAISLTIQGTTAGVKTNSVIVTSNEGGPSTAASATITVVGPPSIAKVFIPNSIPLNGTTALQFTITNGNTVPLTGVGFTDTLPTGLTVASSTSTVCGGTLTTTAPTGIALSGATVAASGQCQFSVTVTGAAAGGFTNTTGAVTSNEGGTGNTASANLSVVAPPSIAKAFNPTGVPLNGVSTLTFTITNPAANTVAELGVAFTDTLPAGLVVATPNNINNNCGGTATATANSGTISLAGGIVAVNSNCTLSVSVTATVSGVFNNTTGNVSSTNGGTGNTASATLSVASPPTIAKAFGASAVAQNGTTGVSFTIINPNPAVTLTGISFTDSLPAGLVVATPNGVTDSCGGTVTAVAGSSTITFTGGSLDPAGPGPMANRPRTAATRGASNTSNAQGSCVITVNLLVTGTGTLSNTTGPISANESGPGNPSNTATLEVVQAPTVNKAFGAATIPLSGTTSLTFNIANPNTSTPLVNITLTDNLPSGLVVATPNGLTGSCAVSSTITATAGSGSISLTNLNLPASGSCSFAVNVTGTTAGTKNNTTGNITATFDDGTGTFRPITGGTASASLVVVAPPSIAKAFSPATIAPGGVSALTFTITNPAANTVAESGVAVTDTLPSGVVIATPNGASGTCNGGTVTAVAGSGSITLTGGTIAAASNCVFSVNVTAAAPGAFTNTTGAVSSTNGGTGNTASAVLNVLNASLSITKTHQGTFHRGQNGAQYFLTVSDSAAAGPTVGTVTVVDTLPVIGNPHNLVPVSLAGTGWTCDLPSLTCTRSDVLAPGASYPVITFTVNIPQNITNHFTNTATVSGGGDPNSHTASDPVSLGPPIQITSMDSGTASVVGGNPAVFNFMVDATAINPPSTVVAFTCSGLPSGSACIFSPLAEGQGLTQLTMTVTTLGPGLSMAAPPASPKGKNTAPLYATLLFPVFGLLGISVRRSRGKKLGLRLGLALGSLAILLALAGCGGSPRAIPTITTTGTFTVTVTGTAQTAQGVAQGSATVSLTVQK